MLRSELKSVAVVGSYGWGMVVRQSKELLKMLRMRWVASCKTLPKDEDAGNIRELAKAVAGETLDG